MPIETTIEWEGRTIRLSYQPRYCETIDHVEIESEDGEPLPITETGYCSHFFGPVEPALTIEEVATLVENWLRQEAAAPAWQAFLEESRQPSLF